jgi:hypothetical protein
MPLEKADTFAFLKMCSNVGILQPFYESISRARTDKEAPREPGTRFLEDANLTLANLDLDEINELVEAAGPLITFLASQPELVRAIVDTRIVQRKLGGLSR